MLKDILTFGGNSKLKKEVQIYEHLQQTHILASQQYNLLVKNRSVLFYNLMLERNEALRNFELLKSLIKRHKEIKSKKADNNKDKLSIEINLDLNKMIKIEDSDNYVKSIDNSIRNISKSTGNSFDRLMNSFNNNGTISKQDLKGEALMLGVDMLGEAFNYIGNLNDEIAKKRKKVQGHISKLEVGLSKILDSYGSVYADSLRIDEIFQFLNKSNQMFIEKYKSIMNKHFIDYDLSLKKSETESFNTDLEQDIKSLIIICNEYSKTRKIDINNIK